jgi:hypothetical protein
MGNNNSQSQEKPVSLEARLGQIMRQAREKGEQKQKAKEKADYDNHINNVIQAAGGHGQGVNIRGEPINTNRFNVSRQKSPKRKSSGQKSSKQNKRKSPQKIHSKIKKSKKLI